MSKRLTIAEKSIAAKRIAEILSEGKAKTRKEGTVSVFEIGDQDFVVPLRGHIVDVDYPKKHASWQMTDLKELVDAPVVYSPSVHSIASVLRKYARDCDEVIVATDYDTEGESIGREALEIVQKAAGKTPLKIRRAKFSAITEEDIMNAFKKPGKMDYDLADAADSRREIDLMWGAVLTRFISLASGQLGSQFLSVGRVQTPTLALVVDREKERRKFKPKPYWLVIATFEKDRKRFKGIHEKERFWDKQEADRVLEKTRNARNGTVTDVKRAKRALNPPVPFNTTEFLRAASSIGLSPARAMSIAESLYMRGFISYPRTDNTKYPATIDVREILKKLKQSKEFGSLAEKILSQKEIKPTEGKKRSTDHPPIHPVSVAKKSQLQSTEWRVYELIVRRFLATLAGKCELRTLRVVIRVASENFIAQGQRILTAGWREYYPYGKLLIVELPESLEKDDVVDLEDVNREDKETKPKPSYSPANLIKLMEENNLGTKSTRHEIIQKLLGRHYITGRSQFEPTDIAFAVVGSLESYAPDIAKPAMTAALEKEMEEVQEGRKTKKKVVEESRKLLHKALDELQGNREEIRDSLRKAIKKTNTVGKCPTCGGNLTIVQSPRTGKKFVGCSEYPGCRTSYPLPAMGKVIPVGKECDTCGLPVIRVLRKGRRPYEMCINHKCKSKEAWRTKKDDKSD
jgi:DNA topoisomerase-1